MLIDEYDESVAKFLYDLKTLKRVRSALHDFYEKLKNNSKSIRFLLMTGVTKRTKLSVFLGQNHIKDRSMDKRFATLLGYTPHELDCPLRENVESLGKKNGMYFKGVRRAILSWYDGYRFSLESTSRVCNPVSLGNAIESDKLKGYWEATGKATLIINRVEMAGMMPGDLENVSADAFMLNVCDAETLPLEALLYQGLRSKRLSAAIRRNMKRIATSLRRRTLKCARRFLKAIFRRRWGLTRIRLTRLLIRRSV